MIAGRRMIEKAIAGGRLVELAAARVPVDDRAVLFGESLFETVRAYRGVPFRLWRHLERLAEACAALRLPPPASTRESAGLVALLLEANGLAESDARVRITVTGGMSQTPRGLERGGPPGLYITARSYEPPSGEQYERGLDLVIAGIRRNSSSPLSRLKTGNYLDSLLARQEALDRGADDALMLTAAGNIAEATSSNVFMVRDGELLTPDMGCGFLPGVTREAVIELCLRDGIPCREVTEGPGSLADAREVFLTNSMFGIMPVRRAGARALPDCPGPVTRRLWSLYRELVAYETSRSRG